MTHSNSHSHTLSQKPSDDMLSHILSISDLTLLSSLFSSLPFNIYVKNREGQFIFISSVMAEMMQKPAAEILGKNDFALHPPELAQKYRDDDAQVMRTRERRTFDEKWQAKDSDQNMYIRVCKVPFINQKTSELIGTMGVFWDQTEQILTEKELLESKEKYAAVIEQAYEGILFLDSENENIIETNRAFQEMTGYSEEELLQFSRYSLIVHDQIDIGLATKKLKKVKQYGPIARTYIRKDESLLHTEVSVKLIQYQQKTTILIVVRDMSKRIKTEAEQQKLKTLLRQSQQLESIGVMAGGVAHDLNNILSGIVAYPEILLLDMPKESPLYAPLLAIQESGKRAAAVVADLLTVARGVGAPKNVIEINTLVSNYLGSPEFLRLAQENPFVSYQTHLSDNTRSISCSPIHVTKCIMNLVVNATEAIDYSGAITINTENHFLKRSDASKLQLSSGDYVLMHIYNSGPPIQKNDLPHIFEPFYTKKQIGKSGTGLGLTIVWTTMQELGGTVLVESDNSGTIFSLYFPALQAKESATQHPIADAKQQLYEGSVLIIDDEETLRDIGRRMFTHLGYQTHLVASGEEAIAFMAENSVDLLLLDMQMPPGINGYTTYQEICKMHPQQKGIIASGFATDDNIRKTRELGPMGFIKKPYSFQDIETEVRKLLTSKP